MRAYVRSQSPIQFEAIPEAARGPAPDPRPASWERVCQALESAAEHADRRLKPTLTRVAHCGGLSVARGYDCGTEEETLPAWCGHAYCPACASEEGAQAARFIRAEWESRILSVEVPCGGDLGSPLLPAPGEVAGIRAAWARVTKTLASETGFQRLESIPRVVISPRSVTLFARLPFALEDTTTEIAAEELTHALRRACQAEELRGEVALISREEAAASVKEALNEQSRRFVNSVEQDLERQSQHAWRSSYTGDASQTAGERALAKRWVASFEACHAERRRNRILGGKDSLPAPGPGQPREASPVCPSHGGHCHVLVTRVRERQNGALVMAYPGDQVPGATGTQAASFFARAAEDGTRQRGRAWQHGQDAIQRRMRRAG